MQIAANALAVIIEDRGDSGDVCGAGITCHQMLDENTANKRPHVWMVENVIESVREILFRGLARGQKAIVHCALVLKQLLGIAIVQVLVRDQGSR